MGEAGFKMKDPKAVHLTPPDKIRALGWQAECRDADGHLTRTHAPFETDKDIVWLVREALEHGDTITIWPTKYVTPSAYCKTCFGSGRIEGGSDQGDDWACPECASNPFSKAKSPTK